MDPTIAAVFSGLTVAIVKLWADIRAGAKKCEIDRKTCEEANSKLRSDVAVLLDRDKR